MGVVNQVGAFTSQDAAALNANFAILAPDFYIDGNYGYDGNPGTSPQLAFKSPQPLDYLLPKFRRENNTSKQIVIGVSGVINYEWSTPIVNDVMLVGLAGQPRQATTSGVANGGGATWLSPTGGTGCLLTVNGQAWTVRNLFFNNSATAAPCVRIQNVGDPPLSADGAWTTVEGCQFNGSDDGLSLMGGGGVVVRNNRFIGFSGSGDKALITESGAGGGTGSWARILNNEFLSNATHINAVAHNWEIAFNHFSYINAGVTTTVQITLSTGSNNSVHDNYFDLPHNTNGISAMFVGGTNDRWYFNKFATVVTTDIFAFGVPAS